MKPYGGFGVSASQLTKPQWHTIHNPSSKLDLDNLFQNVGEGEKLGANKWNYEKNPKIFRERPALKYIAYDNTSYKNYGTLYLLADNKTLLYEGTDFELVKDNQFVYETNTETATKLYYDKKWLDFEIEKLATKSLSKDLEKIGKTVLLNTAKYGSVSFIIIAGIAGVVVSVKTLGTTTAGVVKLTSATLGFVFFEFSSSNRRSIAAGRITRQ